MLNSKVVYEFKKNAEEKVMVKLGNFKGKDVVDIRVFYNADEAGEDWRPSKKGIMMRANLIPELKKAANLAHDEWQNLINKLD